MEEKNIKVEDSKVGKIAGIWLGIIIITYVPASYIIGGLVKYFTDASFYGVYYQVFWVDLLYVPGFSLFLMGLIINELIYFYKCRKHKNLIALIIILLFICGITYKFMSYSETYEFYKDLHYVTENTYCEDVQELKNVYVSVTTGKVTTKALYIQTSEYNFDVGSNIVDESDYDSFKQKYKDVKKVRIRYLPNSEILLSIEPVKD